MKKILPFILLAIFVIGLVPFASAEETTTRDTTDTSVNAGARAEKREQAKNERMEKKDNAREERTEKRAEEREMRGAGKEISAAVRARIQEHKKAFTDFRTQLKDCKGQKTDSCENTRKQVRSQAKLYLKDTVQKVLDDLKNLRERAAVSTDADNDESVKDLDVHISAVTSVQARINALPANATTDQIKQATQDVQQKTKKAARALKVHNAKQANFGFHGILVRAEHLEKKLDKTLARLQEKGADTSAANPNIAAFKTHLKLARENADKAKAKFAAARTSETDFDTLVKEGHAFLKTAREELRQAQISLKEAVRAIKTLRDGAKILAEEAAKKDPPSVNASATANASARATT